MLRAVKWQIQQISGEEKMVLKTGEVHTTHIYFITTLKTGNINLEGLSIKAKLIILPMCWSKQTEDKQKNVNVTVTEMSILLLKQFPAIWKSWLLGFLGLFWAFPESDLLQFMKQQDQAGQAYRDRALEWNTTF